MTSICQNCEAEFTDSAPRVFCPSCCRVMAEAMVELCTFKRAVMADLAQL